MDQLKKIEVDQNSMFLWGDGIFTSFLVRDGKVLFGDSHFDRLQKSLSWLSVSFSVPLRNILQKELESYKEGSFKGRLSLFYQEEQLCYSFHLKPFQKLKTKNLQTHLSPNAESEIPNYIKRPSYGLKVNCLRKLELDSNTDCLWFNKEGKIIHSTFSNVFFLNKRKEIVTPKLDRGYLKGIGLREFQKFAQIERLHFYEDNIFLKELESYVGCFLINSVSGILPINSINGVSLLESEKFLASYREKWDLYKSERLIDLYEGN